MPRFDVRSTPRFEAVDYINIGSGMSYVQQIPNTLLKILFAEE